MTNTQNQSSGQSVRKRGDSPASSPATNKKRGGQPNNRNAFKHGFYSKHFIELEKRAIEELPLSDLTPEIDLIRVNIDRFMQAYTASLGELTYEQNLAALRVVTLAAGRVASLERIQAYVNIRAEEAEKIQEHLEKVDESIEPDQLEIENRQL